MPTSHQIVIDLAIDEQGRTVLIASGDIDLRTAPELRRRIERAAEPGGALVIDLRDVTFMDSPGLGTLIHCDRVSRQRGGHLVLRGASGDVRELFEVVRLAHVIELE